MRIIDLTHTLNPEVTLFPGSEIPSFEPVHTLEKDGWSQLRVTMLTHTGTHLDAPFHMIKGGKTVDELPVEQFYGKAVAVDCRGVADNAITVEWLAPYADLLQQAEFLIIHTGWWKKWKTPAFLEHFPVLTPEAARWLEQFSLKGIGLDTISIDQIDSTELPVHHIVLGRGHIIIENLANLDQLPSGLFTFSCFPMKIEKADGCPIRAAAIVEA